MSLEEREQALIRLVDDYEAAECRSILAAAQADVSRRLSLTYRQARARLHERVLAERSNTRGRIQAIRAERETRRRAGVERANARLLELAWPHLRRTLEARWQDPETRRRWIRFALTEAARALPAAVWTIRHPPDWDARERDEVAARISAQSGHAPRWLPDDGLAAGLAIESRGAILDAGLDGLLGDRRRLEARLLALFAAARGDSGAPS